MLKLSQFKLNCPTKLNVRLTYNSRMSSVKDNYWYILYNVRKQVINNGNCTSCRAIWSEIKRVITKSRDREAGVRAICNHKYDFRPNCTTRSGITTLLYSF